MAYQNSRINPQRIPICTIYALITFSFFLPSLKAAVEKSEKEPFEPSNFVYFVDQYITQAEEVYTTMEKARVGLYCDTYRNVVSAFLDFLRNNYPDLGISSGLEAAIFENPVKNNYPDLGISSELKAFFLKDLSEKKEKSEVVEWLTSNEESPLYEFFNSFEEEKKKLPKMLEACDFTGAKSFCYTLSSIIRQLVYEKSREPKGAFLWYCKEHQLSEEAIRKDLANEDGSLIIGWITSYMKTPFLNFFSAPKEGRSFYAALFKEALHSYGVSLANYELLKEGPFGLTLNEKKIPLKGKPFCLGTLYLYLEQQYYQKVQHQKVQHQNAGLIWPSGKRESKLQLLRYGDKSLYEFLLDRYEKELWHFFQTEESCTTKDFQSHFCKKFGIEEFHPCGRFLFPNDDVDKIVNLYKRIAEIVFRSGKNLNQPINILLLIIPFSVFSAESNKEYMTFRKERIEHMNTYFNNNESKMYRLERLKDLEETLLQIKPSQNVSIVVDRRPEDDSFRKGSGGPQEMVPYWKDEVYNKEVPELIDEDFRLILSFWLRNERIKLPETLVNLIKEFTTTIVKYYVFVYDRKGDKQTERKLLNQAKLFSVPSASDNKKVLEPTTWSHLDGYKFVATFFREKNTEKITHRVWGPSLRSRNILKEVQDTLPRDMVKMRFFEDTFHSFAPTDSLST